MSDYEVESTAKDEEDAGTPDIVQEAIDRFNLCVSAEEKQRNREIDALKFQVPELQWPDEVRTSRSASTMGSGQSAVNIAARPMLSIPKLDQPIQLVLNQEKAAHLGVQVHPLNEDANDETAEVLQGLYRAIEVDSRAGLARSWGFERLVKAGRGVYRILKEYDDTSDHPSDQKIVIKRIYEQGCVYADPAATEPDKSDAEYVLVVEDIPLKRYRRLFPDSTLGKYSDEEFTALGNEKPGWISGEKESVAIRVCEYFYCQYEQEPVEWDGSDGKKTGRTKEKRIVHWCKVNAVEELDKNIWDGQYLPFVWLTRELIPFDGDQRCVGIIEPNKDAQRLFNYAASASVEMAALETKASHAIDPRQIAGYEQWWYQKNTRNFPVLPYTRVVDGVDLGPPVPIQADMSKMQVNALLLSQAGDFIHAGTSTFEPSLGNTTPNVRTKGGTLALQQQSEQANSHWIQILADIGMTHEAKIVLDLIPHVYDRPGRVARILDTEDNSKQVMLNAPFRMQGKRPVAVPPPGAPQPPSPPGLAPGRPVGMGQSPAAAAVRPMGLQGPPQPPPGEVKHYDLKKGRYGVTVSIGKAYKSRVEQGKDELGQLFAAEPQLFQILGDIYLKFADFPGHREAAERVKKMLPPQLQDKDQQGDPAQELERAKAAIAQMQQQLKELEPERVKAQVAIETTKAKAQADTQQAQLKSQADVEIARMNNATKIAVARITAAKESYDASKEDYEERLALAVDTAHEAEQNQLDREHEMAMGQQGHQQALEQGAQGVDGQMAAQAQQAALQPPAGNGAGE